MAPDELALACRLAGLSVDDLWLRYLELGGGRARSDLAARLEGASWPEQEDRYLTVVADEALRDEGLPALVPAVQTPDLPVGVGGGAPDPVAAALLAAHVQESRLATLFDRSRRARARSRELRRRAEVVQRAWWASRTAWAASPSGSPGGR